MVNEENNQGQSGGEENSTKLSFFGELKRRKIFRVAITYAVVSWVIIQVAATTFGSFGIPEWAFRFVVLMVLLGFPVAIMLAWAFEVTPDGVRKTASIGSGKGDRPAGNGKRNWYTIGMAALLPTLIFGTLAVFFYFTRSSVPPGDPIRAPVENQDRYEIGTIAVLPFTLFSENTGLRATADGIHDEMLTVLSEMEPLNVVSRTSTLKFSSETSSISEMGKILGADFIVEGSIQQAVGDKVSITIQLIHASDDEHVWAQSFDQSPERPDEPLVFQKELAFQLAIGIYQSLEKNYPPRAKTKETREQLIASLESKLMKDFADFFINWKIEGWSESYAAIQEQIDQILRIDPDNFSAHDANAALIAQAPEVGLVSFFDLEWQKDLYLTLKRSYTAAPEGFETNKHLGYYYFYCQNTPQRALPYSRKAVKLDKEYRGGVDIYTYWILLEALCATGQSAAAIRISEEATESGLTHFSGPAWFWTKGHQMLRRNEEQLTFFNRQLKMALANDNEIETGFYRFWIAFAEADWMGQTQPIKNFMQRVQEEGAGNSDLLGPLAFMLEDYDSLLKFLSDVEMATSWSQFMAFERAGAIAWAYERTGNTSLARSYFKGYLNELRTSQKGIWMERFQPDVYAALNARGHAHIGEKDSALEWVEKAQVSADPARQFEDYFQTMYELAVTFTLLGNVQQACELLDLILSSPSGYSTGGILIDPFFKDLFESPHFETVVRKHADQLKDPGILASLF